MKHNTIDKNKNTGLTNARYKTKTIKRDRPDELLSGQPRSARHTGKPVENGDAGCGMRAGRTSTGQKGGVKGGRGGGISKLQVQV